jgi:hypothetical protein
MHARLRPRQIDLLLAPGHLADELVGRGVHGAGYAVTLLQDNLVVVGMSGSSIASGEAPLKE